MDGPCGLNWTLELGPSTLTFLDHPLLSLDLSGPFTFSRMTWKVIQNILPQIPQVSQLHTRTFFKMNTKYSEYCIRYFCCPPFLNNFCPALFKRVRHIFKHVRHFFKQVRQLFKHVRHFFKHNFYSNCPPFGMSSITT